MKNRITFWIKTEYKGELCEILVSEVDLKIESDDIEEAISDFLKKEKDFLAYTFELKKEFIEINKITYEEYRKFHEGRKISNNSYYDIDSSENPF